MGLRYNYLAMPQNRYIYAIYQSLITTDENLKTQLRRVKVEINEYVMKDLNDYFSLEIVLI